MDLQSYLQLARRRWWLLLLGPVLAGSVAFFVSSRMTPVYETSSTLLVNQTQNPGILQYNDILTSERLTNTYAQLVERHQVFAEVLSRLRLPIAEEQLARKISVSTVRNTQLLRITARDPQPFVAALLANTTARAFIDDNSRSLARPGTVTIAEEARVPGAPSYPNTRLNTVLAAMVGLMAACGIALLLEYLDDTVKASDETETTLGLPTIATVRRLRLKQGRREPDWQDAYLQLRTNVHFASIGAELKTILVTSCGPGEGKSTTAAGLATVLAQAGEKVILVDTDLRRPTLHKGFEVPNSFGLTGLLLTDADDPGPALMDPGVKNLMVLPSGPIPPNPADLLLSPGMERIIGRLRERADFVVFDSPPVLAATDATILAARADGTVLVAEANATRTENLRHALQDMSRAQARILGVVVNKVRSRRGGYYGSYRYGANKQVAEASARLTKPKQVA